MNFILFCVLLAHIRYAVYATNKLWKSVIFSRRRKIIHAMLIWCFPFLWGWVVVTMTKKSPGTDEEELGFDDVNPNPFRNRKYH
ncbi:hypothetical protein BH11BAC7_BH11BAC7_16570 [soil metagenome]